jgi:hypothetical protein
MSSETDGFGFQFSGFRCQVSGKPIRVAACDERFCPELITAFYKIHGLHPFDFSRLGVIHS